MAGWLHSLIPWGSEFIVWAQLNSPPWLVSLCRYLTTLGYEEFYLVLLPLIYWCIDRQFGVALGYLSLLSTWVNTFVKYLFGIPRPSDPRIKMLAPRPETSPAFPSGHAQSAVTNWGLLALRVRRWYFWALALLLMAGIGTSRVVLGVHYPQDVIGGWVIGLVLLVFFALAAPLAGRWVSRRGAAAQLLLAAGLPLVLIFLTPPDSQGLYPSEEAVTPLSAIIGFGIGLVMERAAVRFDARGRWQRRAARYLVGMAIVAAVYGGPKLLIPESLVHNVSLSLRFVRYGLLGWTVAFLCPWLFLKLGLVESEVDPALTSRMLGHKA
jgi:membrane-associated phospholipid phosphatase